LATTFSLRLPRPPTQDELRALLDEPEVAGLDEIPEPWPAERYAHVALPGLSTRGVEIGPEGDTFTVRTLSCSAPEELAAAVRLVAGLARAHAATVQREGSGDLDPDAFLAAFDAAWIARTVEEDFEKLRILAADRAVTMPGPTRTVTLGPATLGRVGPGTEPLLRVMRDVLYPNGVDPEDEGTAYVSKGIRLTQEGREMVVHAVAPGVDYFLSGGDVYALMDEPTCHIPVAALPGLAPEHVTPVDDATVRLAALEGDAWSELLDRARVIGHADPFDALPAPERPARPPGTLLPLLRPPTWRNRDAVVTRTLLGPDHAVGHMPLVTIVVDTPTSVASMPKEGWPEPETATLALAEAAAVRNLEQLDLPFVEDMEDGRLVGLTVLGEYAAELLLSKGRLDQVHAKLGELVVAAAPVRGIARFRRGDDIQATGTLIAWARYCFEDAGRRAEAQPGLSPLCFGVLEGRVQAVVQARGGDEPASADAEDTDPTDQGGGAIERAALAAAAPAPSADPWPTGSALAPVAGSSAAPAPTAPPDPAAEAPPGKLGMVIGIVVALVSAVAVAYAILG